jgi:magnesium-transporting ATPase (P-type)
LSINVTDTISHGVEPSKGNIKAISELDWHVLSVHEALQRLGSSETQGLDDNQAQRRLQQYGKNILSPPPTRRIRKTYLVSTMLTLVLIISLVVLGVCCSSLQSSVSSAINLSVFPIPTAPI